MFHFCFNQINAVIHNFNKEFMILSTVVKLYLYGDWWVFGHIYQKTQKFFGFDFHQKTMKDAKAGPILTKILEICQRFEKIGQFLPKFCKYFQKLVGKRRIAKNFKIHLILSKFSKNLPKTWIGLSKYVKIRWSFPKTGSS